MASNWQIILSFHLWVYKESAPRITVPKNKNIKYLMFGRRLHSTLLHMPMAHCKFLSGKVASDTVAFFSLEMRKTHRNNWKAAVNFWNILSGCSRHFSTTAVWQHLFHEYQVLKKLCMVIMKYINFTVSHEIWSILLVLNYLGSLGIYFPVS